MPTEKQKLAQIRNQTPAQDLEGRLKAWRENMTEEEVLEQCRRNGSLKDQPPKPVRQKRKSMVLPEERQKEQMRKDAYEMRFAASREGMTDKEQDDQIRENNLIRDRLMKQQAQATK